MADIFISYAREDQLRMKPLVRLLESQGWTVFWDLNIPPGDTWRSWIGRHLDEARCLIVAWSADSIDSRWVQEEADEGIRAKKPVIPILLDTVLPPLGYRTIQAADFSTWDGKAEASIAVNLLERLAQKLGPPPRVENQRKAEEEEKPRPTTPTKRSTPTTVPLGREREPLSSFHDTLRDGGEGPEMVVIPAGSFWMGSPEDEPERSEREGPRHRVEIPSPFALGRTAVTFDQYDRFAKATNRDRPSGSDWGRGSRPVINVNWDDAVAYAKWLCEQNGRRYRLPTEAEWEYACRAGTETPFSTGDCIHTEQANYCYWGNYDYNDCGANTGIYRAKTVPTGSLPPNPWGLHEMHGNIWEWVQDCWHKDYDDRPRPPTDGSAWEKAYGGECGKRVIRGGSWSSSPWFLRSADRDRNNPVNRYDNIGFRLAQDL